MEAIGRVNGFGNLPSSRSNFPVHAFSFFIELREFVMDATISAEGKGSFLRRGICVTLSIIILGGILFNQAGASLEQWGRTEYVTPGAFEPSLSSNEVGDLSAPTGLTVTKIVN